MFKIVEIEDERDLLSFEEMLKSPSVGNRNWLERIKRRNSVGQDIPFDSRPTSKAP